MELTWSQVRNGVGLAFMIRFRGRAGNRWYQKGKQQSERPLSSNSNSRAQRGSGEDVTNFALGQEERESEGERVN